MNLKSVFGVFVFYSFVICNGVRETSWCRQFLIADDDGLLFEVGVCV